MTFDDDRDADDAVANLDGKNGWKVERARPGRRDGGGGGYGGGGGGYGGGGYGGGGDRYGGGGGGYGGGGDRYGGGGGGYGVRPAFGSSKCYACGEVGDAWGLAGDGLLQVWQGMVCLCLRWHGPQ